MDLRLAYLAGRVSHVPQFWRVEEDLDMYYVQGMATLSETDGCTVKVGASWRIKQLPPTLQTHYTILKRAPLHTNLPDVGLNIGAGTFFIFPDAGTEEATRNAIHKMGRVFGQVDR